MHTSGVNEWPAPTTRTGTVRGCGPFDHGDQLGLGAGTFDGGRRARLVAGPVAPHGAGSPPAPATSPGSHGRPAGLSPEL